MITDSLGVQATELTKKFEEFIRGSARDISSRISAVDNLKGEFVVICSGSKK